MEVARDKEGRAYYWNGKPIDTYSKKELLDIVIELAQTADRLRKEYKELLDKIRNKEV